jgi:hypothetical protein
MAEVKIRDLDEGHVAKIDAFAAAAGMSREGWLRQLIIDATKQPVIRERYGIKFDNGDKRGGGVIHRIPSNLGGRITATHDTEGEALRAVDEAEILIRRNAPGDAAEAIRLLKAFFDYVYEIPV